MAEEGMGIGDRMVAHLKQRVMAIPSEVGQQLKHELVKGAYELGGLWTGNAYRGDLGLLTSSPDELQKGGVHGPAVDGQEPQAPAIEPPDTTHAVHEATLHQQYDAAFVEQAAYYRDQMERGDYSPKGREALIDTLMEQNRATREAFDGRGMAPPLSSVLSRDEMREIVEPERYRDQQKTVDAVANEPQPGRSEARWQDALKQMQQEQERGISR